MSLRRTILLCCALIIIPACLYSGFWLFLAQQTDRAFLQWVETRRGHGWDIQWADKTIAGFPGAVSLRITQPSIHLPSDAHWKTDAIGVKLSPRHPNSLKLAIAGTHDVQSHGWTRRISLADGRFIINIEDDGTISSATLQAHSLDLHHSDQVLVSIKDLAVTWDPRPADINTSHPRTDFSATAHTVALPSHPAIPLDRQIGLIAMDGVLQGGLPDIRHGLDWTGWGRAGGSVEIKHLAVDWAPMAATGSGTIGMDGQGQWTGQLATRLRGFDPLTDRLRDNGTISPDMAVAAKAMFALMSRPDPQGRPSVHVPLSLHGQTVLMGNTPIFQFPPIPPPSPVDNGR